MVEGLREPVRCGASTEDGEASAGDWRWGSPRCSNWRGGVQLTWKS
ncbi:hypothetical protein [Scytonema sp. PCC 10023]